MVVTDKQIAEEEEKFEEINIGFEQLLASLKLTRGQLITFAKDPEQFTDQDWETMEKMKANFDQKLSHMPKRHPAATRRSLATIQPGWIFVR